MATRSMYNRVSGRVRPHIRLLHWLLAFVLLGGFGALGALAALEHWQMMAVVGRLWFSVTGVLAVLICCGHWPNPERDSAAPGSLTEGWEVTLINLMLVVALLLPWLIE